jgi:phosphoglycolate phosphatase
MIGDSRTDIATARAAGIPTICVPFGYTDVPIETLEPDLSSSISTRCTGAASVERVPKSPDPHIACS